MKKIVIKICAIIGLSIITTNCTKDDISYYKEDYDAVRFPARDLVTSEKDGYDAQGSRFYASYTFIENPFAEYFIYDLPVMLIGNTASHDRNISYTVDEEKSTAPAGSYEVLETILPTDSVKGYIRLKLYNTEELQDKTYELFLTLKSSEDLTVGPDKYIRAAVQWNNAIPAPSNSNHVRTYNMMIQTPLTSFVSTSMIYYSPNALKTIVAALGWDDWNDYSVHGTKYNSAAYGSYKYLPKYGMIYNDQSYKSYALKLANYIKVYNEAHPDAPLIHDAGGMKGQPIVARSY